jgi:hypothetical protein
MHYDIQWNLNGSDNQFPHPHDPSPFNPQQPDILAIPLSEILMKANLGTATRQTYILTSAKTLLMTDMLQHKTINYHVYKQI